MALAFTYGVSSTIFNTPNAGKKMTSLGKGFVKSQALVSSSFLNRACALPRVVRNAKPTLSTRKQVHMILTPMQMSNKTFQLEEMEDSATCVSAIYLKEDGTLSLGKTDGPQPSSVRGTWNYDGGEEELRIDLTRCYEGQYSFEVRRHFVGHLDSKKNSDLVVFAGKLFRDPTDFDPKEAVGYFEMIVATDDLPSEHYDITQSN